MGPGLDCGICEGEGRAGGRVRASALTGPGATSGAVNEPLAIRPQGMRNMALELTQYSPFVGVLLRRKSTTHQPRSVRKMEEGNGRDKKRKPCGWRRSGDENGNSAFSRNQGPLQDSYSHG